MTRFFRSGNDYTARPSGAVDIFEQLPAKTFSIKKNDFTGELYFQVIPDLEVPDKIYGDSPDKRSNRIIRTFVDRYQNSKSTGVLLTGDKGSGKTLLTKVLSNEMLKLGHPTIVINEPWVGQKFNELLDSIKQPAMVLFDEFEKVYDDEQQELLLTLLDGTVNSSKLFVMTSNGRNINEYLTNRPGRIYYKFSYRGIDIDFVESYARDRLINQTHMESIRQVHSAFASFTFDMLATVVEEMNRYDEDAFTAVKNLNIDIANESVTYEMTILIDGEPIANKYYPKVISGNPLYKDHGIDMNIYSMDDDDDLDKKPKSKKPNALESYHNPCISQSDFVSISDGGTITFQKTLEDKKVYFILKRFKEFLFDFRAF